MRMPRKLTRVQHVDGEQFSIWPPCRKRSVGRCCLLLCGVALASWALCSTFVTPFSLLSQPQIAHGFGDGKWIHGTRQQPCNQRDGCTVQAAGSILDKLKRKLAEEANPRGTFWEMDIQSGLPGIEYEVCEATQPDHIFGAAQLLTSRPEEGSAREGPGFMDALGGLGYMRVLSSVSLSSPLTVVAVAEGTGVVGMAEVKSDGYVFNLAVREDWSRRGVGTRLLCWCATKSRERGAPELWMYVNTKNEKAKGFYNKLNFTFGQEEEVEPGYMRVRLSKGLIS